MITLRDYRTGDYESICDRLRPHDYARASREFTLKAFDLVCDHSLNGSAVTAEIDGEPIAVALAYEVAPGVAEVCLMETERIEEFPREAYEASERWLASLEFRRLQAYCNVSFTVSYRYLRNLGFVCEGVLRGFWPDGTDCFLMARLNNG